MTIERIQFEIRRRICREKTTAGNVYPSRSQANQSARRFDRRHGKTSGQKARAFLCSVCGQYHIGRETPVINWR